MGVDQPRVVGKVWGATRCVHRDATHEVWHASVRAGGYSSRHRHRHKTNLFYVLAGVILVHKYDAADQAKPLATVVVSAGEAYAVPPWEWHAFEATTDAEIIETYWTGLQGEDIDRLDEGGVKPQGARP